MPETTDHSVAAIERKASLLTIPTELRNIIYHLVFDPDVRSSQVSPPPSTREPCNGHASDRSNLAAALKFDLRDYADVPVLPCNTASSHRLDPLRTCRQIHQEAQLLALSLTPFHVTGPWTTPEQFDVRSRPLGPLKVGAIRQLAVTARITHLRAMNESWGGVPFGHSSLRLDRLTVVPRRPDASSSAYAEIADLSQCHTLAYILAETLKTLRHVRTIEVRNQGCFTDVVWRVIYQSLVLRMWRWGGNYCGVTFECSPDGDNIAQRDGWFRMHLQESDDGLPKPGNEVGHEALRLAGHMVTAPTPVADHDDGL